MRYSTCSKRRFGPAGLVATLVVAAALAVPASGAEWSTTELHVQVGELEDPFGGLGNAGGTVDAVIYTLQHASGWKYGDNFFFVDLIKPEGDQFDAYGEWYSNFSLGKITGEELAFGPVRDIGLIAGFNFGADPNVIIYLPGARLALDLPGFAFANLDVTAYLPDYGGLKFDEEGNPIDANAAPSEDDTFMVDFNFATKQVDLAGLMWNLEGHVEYIGERDNQFGGDVNEWVLGQPQVRADIGRVLGLDDNTLFAGVEYQFWINKLGSDVDENAVQALVVWRL